MKNRIQQYFDCTADLISSMGALASTSKHLGDIGTNREEIIIDIINRHCPQRVSAFRGGKLIGFKNQESKQIDIIVRCDIAPKFSLNKLEFTMVESALMAIEIKI